MEGFVCERAEGCDGDWGVGEAGVDDLAMALEIGVGCMYNFMFARIARRRSQMACLQALPIA